MKRFTFILLLLILGTAAFAITATWTGTTSINWDTPSNWSPAGVPSSSTDVIIPNTTRKPHVIWANATSNNLTIQPSAILYVDSEDGHSLTVNGSMILDGTLNMSNSGSVSIAFDLGCWGLASVTGTGALTVYRDTKWYSGASFLDSSSTQFNIHRDLYLYSGANFKMNHGGRTNIVGSQNTNIYNNSAATEFAYLIAAKAVSPSNYYVNIHGNSTQPFKVNNDLINFSSNKLTCTPDITVTVLGKVEDRNASNAADIYGIKWQAGTIKMDGATQHLSLPGPGCYLNHLICSATTGVITDYSLTIRGNLTIQRGYLSANGDKTIKISGNWDNQVGPNGFIEGTGRVILTGSGHQYIQNDETFNILEVANAPYALRFTSGKTVTCAQYDWTSGGINMNTDATFTANDLVDNGISGGWWLSHEDGTINLSNPLPGNYIDLKGNLHITHGNFNVYGTSTSYWPYQNSASLTMSGGKLIFHDTGIRIPAPGAVTFTANITGGSIQTAGDFNCYNSNFTPTGGELRMIGTIDAELNMSAGSLNSVYLDKSSRSAQETELSGQSVPITDRNGGFREEFRSNTVKLMSNLTTNNRLFFNAGTLWINGHEVNIGSYVSIHNGTLKMDSALDRIVAIGDISFGNYGNADISQGILETYEDLEFYQGCDVVIPETVSIYLRATGSARIFWWGNNPTQIGNLYIAGSGGATNYEFLCGWPYNLLVNISGNLSVAAGNTLTMNSSASSIEIGGNLDLDGTLIIDGMVVNLQGKPDFASTSSLTIIDGSFAYHSTSNPQETYLKGDLALDNGVFNAGYHYLTVNAGSSNTMTGTDSEIICGGISATNAGTFQLNAGTVKLASPSLFSIVLNVSNGNWLPNVEINTVTGYSLVNNLIIRGDLLIQGGNLSAGPSNSSVTIGGNWENRVGINGFTAGTGRVIFNSSGHQTIFSNQTFYILEVANGNALRFASGKTVTCAIYDWTSGGIDMNTDATFTANDLADIGICGGWWLTHSGGTINISNPAPNDNIGLQGDLHITHGNFNVYGYSLSYWPYLQDASIQMSGGVLEFHGAGVFLSPFHTLTCDITGGLIRVNQGWDGQRTDFNPAGGTIELNGNASTVIKLGAGSSFYNLKINHMGTVSAYSYLLIANDLALAAGKLDVNTYNCNITIGGNWINNVGTTAFDARAGTVTFNKVGGLQEASGTTNFYDVIDAHTGSALHFDGNTGVGGTVTVTNIVHFNDNATINNVLNTVATGALSFYNDRTYNIASYTGGGCLKGKPGSHVIIADLTQDGLYGTFEANNAHLEFHQDSASPIDLNGNLTISASGIVDIYGGSMNCYIGYNANCAFMMGSGSFNVKNNGISMHNSGYTCDISVHGGTITCNGNWSDYRGIFTPTGGSVVMAGTGDNTVTSHDSSWFWNLKVNKIASRDSSEPQFSYDRAGNPTPITRSSELSINAVTLRAGLDIQNASVVTLLGNVNSAQAGAINIGNAVLNLNGRNLISTGDLTLHAQGLLAVDSGASLLMSNGRSININNGGTLQTTGSSILASKISRNGIGTYALNVNSGGVISSVYSIFEYGNANGIMLNAGSLVHASRPFENCIFRNGVSGGSLLTIDNNQDLTIDSASFPTNAGGGAKNVAKTVNSGSVYFSNWSGAFGGPAYEQDSYNRINWQGTGAPQITDLEITYLPATSRVQLSWTYPQAATSYKIYRSLDPVGTFSYLTTTTNTTWSEVVPGPKYFYKVTAVTP